MATKNSTPAGDIEVEVPPHFLPRPNHMLDKLAHDYGTYVLKYRNGDGHFHEFSRRLIGVALQDGRTYIDSNYA